MIRREFSLIVGGQRDSCGGRGSPSEESFGIPSAGFCGRSLSLLSLCPSLSLSLSFSLSFSSLSLSLSLSFVWTHPWSCHPLSPYNGSTHPRLIRPHPPIRHPPIWPSAHPPIRPSGHPSIRPSAHPAIRPSGHPAIRPSAHPPGISLHPTGGILGGFCGHGEPQRGCFSRQSTSKVSQDLPDKSENLNSTPRRHQRISHLADKSERIDNRSRILIQTSMDISSG